MTTMKALSVFLSLCALANAATILDQVPVGTTIQRQLDRLEFYVLGSSPTSDLEHYVAEQYNTLEIAERNLIANVIEAMLEDFRNIVINGNGDLPPLDPYVIDSLGPFDFTTSGVRGTAQIKNLRMEGLMWYVVDQVQFSPIRLTLNVQLTIPRLTVTGGYSAEARISFINHVAGGNFRVFLNRVIFGFDMRLGTSIVAGTLYLRELNIHIDIHDSYINIEGMTGSTLINALINNFIQSITQETIQNEMVNVSEALSAILFDVINDVLKDITQKMIL